MNRPHQNLIEFSKKGGTIKSGGAVRLSGVFLAFFFCLQRALGLDVSSVSGIDISKRFQTIYKIEGHVEYGIVGESMVEKNQKKRIGRFEWKGTADSEAKQGAYYLIWAGVVEKSGRLELAGAKKILFRTPSKKEWNVKAESFEIPDEVDGAYLAVANVGQIMEGKGIYEVENLETKPDRFGGYAWIGIYENRAAPKRYIELKGGLAKLKPGELYEAKVLEPGLKGWVSRVSTFGGDGKAGNGSSNLLNRAALSGSEDWDGSSGEKWDVDSYAVKKFGMVSDEGLTWSIDPLLQWIYAAGMVVQIDLTENRGGEKK